MRIVVPENFDHVYKAPKEWTPSRDGECSSLPVKHVLVNGVHAGIKSFWKPTPEELAALNEGACITLTIIGTRHPPVALKVETGVVESTLPKEILGGG